MKQFLLFYVFVLIKRAAKHGMGNEIISWEGVHEKVAGYFSKGPLIKYIAKSRGSKQTKGKAFRSFTPTIQRLFSMMAINVYICITERQATKGYEKSDCHPNFLIFGSAS